MPNAHASHTLEGLWPPSFAGAIFDFDGTLACTTGLWKKVDLAFFAEHGMPYTPDVHQRLSTLGFTGGARWCIETYGLRESVEDICDEWNRLASALYATEVDLRPGALRYLQALREADVPIALATTNNRHVLSSIRPRVDVDSLFDVVVCSTDVQVSKESPDIYLEASRRLGVECGRCVTFEDILPAARSAKRAGTTVCGVRSDDPLQHVDQIRSVADLWLDEWTGLVP